MIDDTLKTQMKRELKKHSKSWVRDLMRKTNLSSATIYETFRPKGRRFSKRAFQGSLRLLKEYRQQNQQMQDEAKKVLK